MGRSFATSRYSQWVWKRRAVQEEIWSSVLRAIPLESESSGRKATPAWTRPRRPSRPSFTSLWELVALPARPNQLHSGRVAYDRASSYHYCSSLARTYGKRYQCAAERVKGCEYYANIEEKSSSEQNPMMRAQCAVGFL